MINAIIVDDEQHCVDSLLADLAKNCMNVNVVSSCTSAKDAILAIKKHQPQLLFLDIEMPWVDGFEMLELLPSINFSIIFITAFDKFAAKAFRISAIDYLLKPVDAADLIAAVHKVEEKMSTDLGVYHVQNLLTNIKKPVPEQKIALPTSNGYQFQELSSILYCAAEGAYTRVVLENKPPILISRTLGDIEELLPAEIFLRIHHSTVVNLTVVTHYSRIDGGFVTIKTHEKLMVSKARKEALLKQLGLRSPSQ